MGFERQSPRILPAMRSYWSAHAARAGFLAASWELLRVLGQFLRESTPARLRQRYGDVEYDWDYRVNTTSATVGWRDRLLGLLHSPYQPTEPALFHEMMEKLREETGLNFPEYTFIDLGSGKGRSLLMASDYPFARIVGVELLPALHDVAIKNLASYRSDSQKCLALEAVCADATRFSLPNEPLVVYLFNPFPEAGLRDALANIRQSLSRHPRSTYVLYHNPELEHILTDLAFKKIAGTQQYSLFTA